MKITVVTLTYNSRSSIKRGVVEAIMRAATGHEINFIVVDSGSLDGTLDEIRSRFLQTKVVQCPKRNLASCRNIAARNAPPNNDFLCWIDSDVVIPSDYFSRLIPLFDDPNVGSAELRVSLEETPSNTLVPRYYRDAWRGESKGVEPILEGGGTNCLLVRNQLAKEIMIDERFQKAGEDVALHFEIMKRGYRCLIDLNEPIAKHVRIPTVSEEIRRMWQRGEARSLNLKKYRRLSKGPGPLASFFASVFTLSAWVLLPFALYINPLFSVPLTLLIFRQAIKLRRPWMISHALLGFLMSTAYLAGFFKGFFRHWVFMR